MADFNDMLEQAQKKVETQEKGTFKDPNQAKPTRGEEIDVTSVAKIRKPFLNRRTPSTSMKFLMLGYVVDENGCMTYIVKYSSKKGERFYVARPEEVRAAIKQAEQEKKALKAIIEADNTRPIKFEHKGKPGYLVPLPPSVFAELSSSSPKKRKQRSDSGSSHSASTRPQKRSKSLPKSDSDDEQESCSQEFAHAYPAARKRLASQTGRVQFERSGDATSDSGGMTLSSSGDAETAPGGWVKHTQTLLRKSGILRLMRKIGSTNIDLFLRSIRANNCLFETCLTSPVLSQMIQVGMQNEFAGKTPGMVDDLSQLASRTAPIPGHVVLAARDLFMQAIKDSTTLFLLDPEHRPLFDVSRLPANERSIYMGLVDEQPDVKPFCDLVRGCQKVTRTTTMTTIFAHVDTVVKAHKVLRPYRALLVLVYGYGLTAGFCAIPNNIILDQYYSSFAGRNRFV